MKLYQVFSVDYNEYGRSGFMDVILYNPNVAYLLLVGGLILVITALFSPGTGILELSALVALVLGGVMMFNLGVEINLWALALLILGVIPFILAVRRSRKLIFLGIAIVAFVVGSAYLFQGEKWWQPGVDPLLALVVSLAAGGYIWIATTKVLEADQTRPTHDLGALIGALGEAKTPILNEGTVQVQGELWSAQSQTPIPDGAPIRVVGREGFILEVTQVDAYQEYE
jgi:membrane-bound ClpP family serine protease